MDKKAKNDGEIKTAELMSRVISEKSITNFLSDNKQHLHELTLASHLSELCAEKGIRPSKAIENAGISKTFGKDIFSGKRNPTRDYVIRLAFGFGLNLDECQKLLLAAKRSALYPRIPRDAVIIHCLHNKLTVDQTEDKLYEKGMTTLVQIQPKGEGSENE
jgi:hypothetical protein